MGILWGLLVAELFVTSKSEEISETFWPLSQTQHLRGGETSVSCDTEHLRSGGRRKGLPPELSRATWTRHPGTGSLDRGEGIPRRTGSDVFLACAWVARAILSQF